jgi:hypothetical protein
MWVSHTVDVLEQDPNADALLAFSTAFGISEVYLAVGSGALGHTRLPNFVARLKDNGLRVEALIDCGEFADCQKPMPAWMMRIGDVTNYNQNHLDDQSFDGIHLDLEAWVRAPDYSWVPGLVSDYQAASSALDGSGLTLAADVSGEQMFNNVQASDQQALLDAATRLVLLEYPVNSEDKIIQRVDAFQSTIDLSNATFLVATSVQDFAAGNNCQNGCVLDDIEARYGGTFGYAGWATFRYSDYSNPSTCPGDCCLVCTRSAATTAAFVLEDGRSAVPGRAACGMLNRRAVWTPAPR